MSWVGRYVHVQVRGALDRSLPEDFQEKLGDDVARRVSREVRR